MRRVSAQVPRRSSRALVGGGALMESPGASEGSARTLPTRLPGAPETILRERRCRYRDDPGAAGDDTRAMESRRFLGNAAAAPRGHVLIPVPFDPDTVWGVKLRHHVRGTVNGRPVRGVVQRSGDAYGFTLGPAWLSDCGLAVGDAVTVDLEPEGPQRADLAEDVAVALEASPAAAAFFDSLAQFYRRAYLRWIDATKRRPAERPRRIAEMIRLLEAGHKQRPQQ
jgi:hypothetical protein